MSISLNTFNKTDINSIQNNTLAPKINPNFMGLKKDTVYIKENTADKILRENREYNEGNYKNSRFSKYANIAAYPALATVFGSYFYSVYKIIKSKKQDIPKDELNKIQKNILKKGGIASLTAITSWLILSSYFNNQRNRYVSETKNYFNQINKTGAKLAEKEFNSSYMAAYYNGISGEIYINKNNLNDPWGNYKNKFTLKHELVHAKQYETVARMNDGIRKLNYAMFKNDANCIKKDAVKKQMIHEAYNDIISDKTHKYDNSKFSYDGYEIPFKDYIITMHKLINDEEKNYADIPILINAEHYETVREKFGSLTPEEEQKAEEYYDGILNYVSVDSLSAFNPFSSYRNGVLEKEAYKETPWYTMLI